MTYAVIRFGGKQFKISVGDTVELERQNDAKSEVLLFSDEENVYVGNPVLNDYEVVLSKVNDTRASKIRVARFRSKSRYRKVKGHKQPISIFKVESMGRKVLKKTEIPSEKVKKETSDAIVEKKTITQKKVQLDKKEIIEAAPRKRGRPRKIME